jgi:hypothetical protein
LADKSGIGSRTSNQEQWHLCLGISGAKRIRLWENLVSLTVLYRWWWVRVCLRY